MKWFSHAISSDNFLFIKSESFSKVDNTLQKAKTLLKSLIKIHPMVLCGTRQNLWNFWEVFRSPTITSNLCPNPIDTALFRQLMDIYLLTTERCLAAERRPGELAVIRVWNWESRNYLPNDRCATVAEKSISPIEIETASAQCRANRC